MDKDYHFAPKGNSSFRPAKEKDKGKGKGRGKKSKKNDDAAEGDNVGTGALGRPDLSEVSALEKQNAIRAAEQVTVTQRESAGCVLRFRDK